ncbi:uncharacterized protein LY89DRAFT_706435 [Mollisia scopiformis]|uniref:FHA domain-containing protein n=1 Tax=Mollisia scopiformis TaxID=149040 RepID=A0A194XF49_MOLSC|nr:uncharacterized protein LY89DRAFT_706435 [Mollisia scopiformis]KUJ18793.1 hypothetical protein LY89DRAFT_706435 [Mollisia scopiformis]
MWVLDTEGDAFKGKRLWLRPGKRFLIGRTQSEDGQFLVVDKTISRKHLVVEVDEVPPADCANPKLRSKITLTDLKTKIGTLVNGEQIRGREYVLDQPENIVTIGKYPYHFRFNWVPVTLSYTLTAKELKANPWTALYERLGPLDIKVLQDFQAGVTTHVVAKKRNTSKGLQALIGGKHIVHNDSFVQALVAAATPGASGAAPLEEDFEANFPDPLDYLPPKGEEPTQRELSAYAPDPARQDMFEGYTFVFYERRQHDNLFKPISEGGGKVSLMEVKPESTTVEDFVRHVKGLAGEKGLGEFQDGTEGKGVIVVRFNPVKGEGTEWFAEFGRNVALHLDHRLIEQNEFLDAILGNDASVLRKPLEVEMSGVVAPPPTDVTNVSFQAPPSSAQMQNATQLSSMAPPSPPRRGRSRRTVKKNFGFDDDDFSGPIASSIPEPQPESMPVDSSAAVESQPHSQGLFVTQDPNMEIDREESPPRSPGKRKRDPSPIFEDSEEENLLDQLAPAAAAFKKQKLARGESIARPAPVIPKPEPRKPPAPTKVKQEINVVEIARQKQEEARALAVAERESLMEQLEGMDVDQMRNLAIIEEVPVVRKPPPIRTSRADESDRWDDKWNGRKDFKRFRRRGATGNRKNERVIVPLEEAKNKDFGIGDDYWGGEIDSQKKKKKGKETQSQNESGGSAPKSRAANRARQILASEAEEEFGSPEPEPEPANIASSSDVEIVPPPKSKAKAAATTTTRGSRSQKSVTSQESTTQSRGKRAAESSASSSKQPPAKKQKQLSLMKGRQQSEDEDEDSDDDLKFKFRRKK